MNGMAFAELVAWLVGGIALGAVYLHLLGRSVAAVEAPGARRAAAGWFLLRFVAAAVVFGLAATQGAAAVVAALLGFHIARTFVLRRMTDR
jgi:hypothetical protein